VKDDRHFRLLKDITKTGAIIGDGSVPDYGSLYPASRGPFDLPRKVHFFRKIVACEQAPGACSQARKIEGTSARRIGS